MIAAAPCVFFTGKLDYLRTHRWCGARRFTDALKAACGPDLQFRSRIPPSTFPRVPPARGMVDVCASRKMRSQGFSWSHAKMAVPVLKSCACHASMFKMAVLGSQRCACHASTLRWAYWLLKHSTCRASTITMAARSSQAL